MGLFFFLIEESSSTASSTGSVTPKSSTRPSITRGRQPPFVPTRVRTTTSSSTTTTTTTTRNVNNKQTDVAEQPATVQETIHKRPSIGLQSYPTTTTERHLPIRGEKDEGNEHPVVCIFFLSNSN